MRIAHIADLHLGIKIGEISLLEDQRFILEKIINGIRDEKADVLVISGDIYDRGVPPQEAVQLFSSFLSDAKKVTDSIIIISGNHDSAERLSFGSGFFANSGIYISHAFNGKMEYVDLEDEYGICRIWMLPFVKPAIVRNYYPDIKEGSFDDAVRAVISGAGIDEKMRNILVAHQFVTAAADPERCDSETVYAGGTENIDCSVFSPFDYVALGHLHTPQHMGKETIRYSGSPLKYSFSEAKKDKSLTIADIKSKGDISIETLPLVPMRDMREVRGYISEIMEMPASEDYMRATLLDENVENAADKLRTVFPNIMRVDFDNAYTREMITDFGTDFEGRSDIELFSDFFRMMSEREMSEIELDIVRKAFEEAKEDQA